MLIKYIFGAVQVAVFALVMIPANVYSFDSVICGDIVITPAEDGGGPWDYTDPKNRSSAQAAGVKGGNLKLVEDFHFTKEVETLVKGKSGSLIGDIDYTLYRFPNHHRALRAMSRLQVKHEGRLPVSPDSLPWKRYAECYFERAIIFRPDDYIVHMLYAMHLHATSEYKEAEKRYQYAATHITESSELYNNMGLLYFEIGDFKQSLHYARKAYLLGYPLPGLKNKLISKGLWEDG